MGKKLGLVLILTGILIFSCQKRIAPVDSGVLIKPYDTATFDYLYVEAIKQKLSGNNGDALKLLEQCLRINPSSDAANFEMAQIAFSIGDNNAGKKYALKANLLQPGNFWYLMILGSTYLQENNLDSAGIYYDRAARLYPEKENIQLTLANIYSESKKYEKAKLIFENLDKKYGINNVTTVSEIQNLLKEGNFDNAEKKAQMLMNKYPDEILFQGLMAEVYRAKGENGKAEELYKNIIEKNPGNPEAQLSLCDFLIKEKNYEELVIFLNTVVLNDKIKKEDKISLFGRLIGIPEFVKTYSDKMKLSIMVLEATYKNDEVILLLMPELMIAKGELAEASVKLEGIIKIVPENYYAWEKLLFVYLQEGNYKMLEQRGSECASKFNMSFVAKVLYATGASENKHFETALDELRKATIIAGDDKELLLQVLSLKADIYYKMGNYDDAFSTFDEALKLNSNDLTILNNYAYYLAERDMKLKEAEEMAKMVIEREGKNTTFLDTYAWVLYKRGKIKDAERIMKSVINSGEKPDAEWYDHLGYILRKRGDCIEAVKNWEIAVRLDSTKTILIKEIEKCQGGR